MSGVPCQARERIGVRPRGSGDRAAAWLSRGNSSSRGGNNCEEGFAAGRSLVRLSSPAAIFC